MTNHELLSRDKGQKTFDIVSFNPTDSSKQFVVRFRFGYENFSHGQSFVLLEYKKKQKFYRLAFP